MSKPSLTIHHLQRGQSERILWLLEELSIPYNLEIHQRDPMLSPPSLKAIHPLGSAPVIVDGDLVLSESMAIVLYILNKYAPPNKLTVAPEDANYVSYIYWLYYVVCTLGPAGTATLFAYIDKDIPDSSPARTFPRERFRKDIGLVEERLKESEYLAGDSFTLVDIMAVWCFTTHRAFLPWSLEPYPHILRYVERLTARPAYKRAMDKGDHGLPILNGVEPGEKKALF